MRFFRATLLFAMLWLGSTGRAEPTPMELIMVEETGCIWCARWTDEIGPIYPLTDIGKAAPLRRIDIRASVPDDLNFSTAPYFTPTFILVQNGVEIGRIEGYPGEDFFWGFLEQLLDQADTSDIEGALN